MAKRMAGGKVAPAQPSPQSSSQSNAAPEIVEALTQALAETSIAQMKAQNFHWNVEGMSFGSLHELFEDIYKDHFEAVDDLAERVKAIGGHAEGSYAAFLERSTVKEGNGRIPARDMVAELAEDERRLSATLRELAETAERLDDMVTNDIALERAQKHDKFAWMLAAHARG